MDIEWGGGIEMLECGAATDVLDDGALNVVAGVIEPLGGFDATEVDGVGAEIEAAGVVEAVDADPAAAGPLRRMDCGKWTW